MDVDAVDPEMAVSEFCKAQAHINSIDKKNDDKKRGLNERIKTYRSILHNELETRKITCFEMLRDGKDASYIRLRKNMPSPSINPEIVMKLLTTHANDSVYMLDYAEKHGRDFPKMVAAAVLHEIRRDNTKQGPDKTSLQISNTKEKGFTRPESAVPSNLKAMASDLLNARDELRDIRKSLSQEKEPSVQKQKIVEESVKKVLSASDPVTKTSRVHMNYGGDEWVYYLRCKEKQKEIKLGVRKIAPLLEMAFAKTLSSQGMGREYNEGVVLTRKFWEEFQATFKKDIDDTVQKGSKVVSTLSLDKAAPKKRQQKTASVEL